MAQRSRRDEGRASYCDTPTYVMFLPISPSICQFNNPGSVVIKFFKPKPKNGAISLPNQSSEDLSRNTVDLEESAAPSRAPHSSLPFDLALAKISLSIEVISYTALCFAADPLTFTTLTMSSSFGSGFGPAVSSVALALYTQRGGSESGKLFGAMSVIQSLW